MCCLVSVIIPAYNCEDYIERCISGALKHIGDDLEVIVVNDGSTDGTEGVVKALAEKDLRVKLFSQTNKGVSAARNAGLSQASGKYVVFSDSDDVFEGENLKLLIDYAENTEADVVAFGRINHYSDGRTEMLIPKSGTINVKYNYEDAFKATILNQRNYGWSSCNKLYKREIIVNNNIVFIDYKNINSEDRLFNLSYFTNVSTVAFFDKCSFHNFVRGDSLSHSASFPDAAKRNVAAFEYVCDYLKELPENVRYKLIRYYFISFVNNVVVLELSVNKSGFKYSGDSFQEVVKGMFSVLEDRTILNDFNKEKCIYFSDNGFKYKMLNALILSNRFFLLAKLVLFGYVKVTDVILVFKTKWKGR